MIWSMAAMRFLEWVQHHPEGVISLPTGRTPEHFIKWVERLLHQGAKHVNVPRGFVHGRQARILEDPADLRGQALHPHLLQDAQRVPVDALQVIVLHQIHQNLT